MMATAHTLKRYLQSGRHRAASFSTNNAGCQMGALSCARIRATPFQVFNSSLISFGHSRDYTVGNGLHVRYLSTTDENDDQEWRTPDDYTEIHRYTPQNEHQRKLVDYTNSLLSTDDKDYPIGAYPYTDLIQMSNCIDSWIASGEHRYLGAHQAEMLVKRLIIERGGGKSVVGENSEEFVGGNIHVTWDMYHLESLIPWLNGLYYGAEFSKRISSIMATFEAEYGEDIDIPYKLIISILCQCYTGHAAAAAEQILHYYESKALAGANYSDLATTETYNGLITSWVKADQSRYPHAYNPPYRHSAHPPANILSEMISLYKQNPHQFYRIRPDAISFNMTITSLSNHKKREQAVASEQYLREVKDLAFHILQSMIETYKKENVHCAPDRVVFETVLNILHARPPANDDADRACELLDEMLDLYSSEAYPHDVKPSTLDFNMVLGLMADQRQVNTATVEKAKRYLTKMEELAEHEEPDVTDGDDYLDSFSADPLLQEYQSSKSNSKPDTITYNSLIKIACNARMPETAQDILNDMIDIANSGDDSVKPDVLSFNTVLNAWSKSNKPYLGSKSAELLQTMQKLSEQGNFNVKPDNVSLTTVINSLIKSSERTRGAPIQAEAIIQKMNENDDYAFKPDTITYTSLIKCWSESGRPKAAYRAEEIIELLHKRYEEGHRECKLDSMAYNVALNAIAKSGVRDSAQRAEAMLQRMKERFDAGDVDVAPNTFSFSTVINAWSKSGDPQAGIRAENLLETMVKLHEQGLHDVAPNTVTYSSCINAWSRSKQSNAGRRANAMLARMDELDNKGYINIKPNVYSYTSAIEAWANSGDPNLLDEAYALFDTLIKRYEAGEEDAKPTPQAFNAMFRAISQSPTEKAKHTKAEELLNRLKQMDEVQPNIATYNTYINACACTEGDRATKLSAINCVFNALSELQDTRLRPDTYTWPAIWKACLRLLDIKQDMQKINMVFELCTRSGAISELVFNNMRNFLPPTFLQKKLNTNKDVFKLTVRDLPSEWTANVKLRRERHKQRNDAMRE